MTKISHLILMAAMALCLSGCVHYVWMKPNGDPSTYAPDSYACQQEAIAAAPPAFQTYSPMSEPPSEVVKTECVNNGPVQRCRTKVISRNVVAPPRTVDLNEDNRDRLYTSCLQARGWVLQAVEDPE